jgi:sugar/nucleoside kinase (ribokinase family)
MSLLIVGSIALDSIETPFGKLDPALGGSAVFGAYAASLFTKPHIVGVVGDDFPKREIAILRARGVETEGLEIVPGGQTFRWGGRYFDDINQRETLFTELNVFEQFQPKLPESYRRISDIFLANIDPDLQLDVLGQIKQPRFVVCDTMNLWINIKLNSLKKLMKKIDVLLLNDEEARLLGDTRSLAKAADKLLKSGIRRLIIKKGEHGCMMFSREGTFAAPALALSKVVDPTGAGDSFAGGMLGWLSNRKTIGEAEWRKAVLVGTAMASFCVEDFSVRKLRRLTLEQLRERVEVLRSMMAVGKV